MKTASTFNSWVTCPKPNPQAKLRLFCFHYAGGGALSFRTWPDSLPPTVEVCAIELPGRGLRLMEPPFTRLDPLIQALAHAPDIAIYGKVVGGGMPIGVIAGGASYLDKIDGGMWGYGDASSPQVEQTFFAGTHCKHPLSMAAARAILQYLKRQGPTLQQQLNQRTSQYVERLNVYFEASKMPIRMAHFGSFFGPVFTEDAVPSDILLMGFDLLRYHLFDKGVLLRGEGGGFLSTAHTDEDIDCIIQAMKDSITELQEAGFFPSPAAQ